MTETVIEYERDGAVAVIKLNGPPANALTVDLVERLDVAISRATDDGVAVVVVASAVPAFFAAGADIKLMQSGNVKRFAGYLTRLRGVIERLHDAPFLSIAACDGHTLGGGLELAMACTLRVAGVRARLGLPEARLGLLPGAGGTQRLPKLVGRTSALELIMSGRSVTAEVALEIGLVDRAVEDALGDAEEWAHELAQGPAEAYKAIVRCIEASEAGGDGMAVEFDEVTRLFESVDEQEGLAAFIEKRRPRFGAASKGTQT